MFLTCLSMSVCSATFKCHFSMIKVIKYCGMTWGVGGVTFLNQPTGVTSLFLPAPKYHKTTNYMGPCTVTTLRLETADVAG